MWQGVCGWAEPEAAPGRAIGTRGVRGGGGGGGIAGRGRQQRCSLPSHGPSSWGGVSVNVASLLQRVWWLQCRLRSRPGRQPSAGKGREEWLLASVLPRVPRGRAGVCPPLRGQAWLAFLQHSQQCWIKGSLFRFQLSRPRLLQRAQWAVTAAGGGGRPTGELCWLLGVIFRLLSSFCLCVQVPSEAGGVFQPGGQT